MTTVDAVANLRAVQRSVARVAVDGREARAVVLSRTLPAPPASVWDALVNAQTLAQWFLPVTGDLRLGGRYQFEGNAGGTITACTPPSRIAATWEFAGDVSWVEVRLDGGGATLLTLTHTMLHSPHWDEFGPGAAGVGWEMALVALPLFVADPQAPLPLDDDYTNTAEGRAFVAESSAAWADAAIAAGEDAAEARAAAQRTAAFYLGEDFPT